MDHVFLQALAYFLFGVGNIFVLSSMWVLGITGTYLGKKADRILHVCNRDKNFDC